MRALRGTVVGCASAASWVAIGLFAGGCGGGSNLDGSSATGAAGAGGADAGAPQAGGSSVPAQGASHVSLVYSASTSCPTSGSNNWSIPAGTLTNSTTVGAQIVDGMDGSSVSCAVRPSGDGYTVSGQLAAGNFAFSVQDTLSPGSGAIAYQGTGPISQYAGDIQMTLKGTECTITVSQTQAAQIGPGRIWADFDCPTFNPTNSATGGCAAMGTFVFGNCAD
jgi:hypothetical protein